MTEAYWRYADGGQLEPALPPPVAKRPRTEHDVPSGHNFPGYYGHDNERGTHRVVGDTRSVGSSYERYLLSQQIATYGGVETVSSTSGGISGHPIDDPRVRVIGASNPVVAMNRTAVIGGDRPVVSLPSDATNTLFVEGLPANCKEREVSHIFRPFVGYREVRLVTKESRRRSGDPLVLCFVDFASPAHAATAMNALQGYKFDEEDRDPVKLKLQFSRFPGARSGRERRRKL